MTYDPAPIRFRNSREAEVSRRIESDPRPRRKFANR